MRTSTRRTVLAAMVAVGCAVFTTAAGSGDDKQPAQAKGRSFEVRMTAGKKFNPEVVEIKVGDTVTWINETGVGHTATPDTKDDFPAQTVNGGKFSPRVSFGKEGTFPYHCVPHKNDGMVGKVVVTK